MEISQKNRFDPQKSQPQKTIASFSNSSNLLSGRRISLEPTDGTNSNLLLIDNKELANAKEKLKITQTENEKLNDINLHQQICEKYNELYDDFVTLKDQKQEIELKYQENINELNTYIHELENKNNQKYVKEKDENKLKGSSLRPNVL